jgi:hypothetical protein
VDDSPSAENWAEVGDAVRERLRELKMSKVRLARETGLSETTIRYLGRTSHKHYRSALIAISVVLRWRHDHLTNILRGQPEKNTPANPLAGTSINRLLYAEVRPLKDEISRLKEITQAMDKKIDTILTREG